MLKKNAIILGGSSANDGIYTRFKSLGYNVVVVDYRENIAFKHDTHILFDATNPNIATLLKKKDYSNIEVVYTSLDSAGLAQREICKAFGLLYAPKKSMIKAHYKNMMHKAWINADLLHRQSIALENFDINSIKSINKDYKVIIKPANACASRGLTVLEKKASSKDLQNAFQNAKNFTTNGLVNIEEFLEGTEYSVELLGDDYGNVSVFSIGKRYYMRNSKVITACKIHYNASDMPHELSQKLAKTAIECYKCLGLKNTLGHFEVMLKPDGTMSPIEIGARSSGYLASHFSQLSTNTSFLEEFKNVLQGKKIYNGFLEQNDISSLYFIYDLPINTPLKKELSLVDFLSSDITCHAFDRHGLVLGKTFKSLEQDTDRYGYEILSGPKDILTIGNILKAENSFIQEAFYG